MRGSIAVSATSPGLVDGFFIRNASSTARTLAELGVTFHGLPGANSVLVAELAGDAQLLARGYWSYWADPERPWSAGRLGPMFRMSDTPQRSHGGPPEPALGRSA